MSHIELRSAKALISKWEGAVPSIYHEKLAEILDEITTAETFRHQIELLLPLEIGILMQVTRYKFWT